MKKKSIIIFFISIICFLPLKVEADSKLACKYEELYAGMKKMTLVLDGSQSTTHTTVKYYYGDKLEYSGVTDLYPLNDINDPNKECPTYASFIPHTIFEKKYELIGLQWGVYATFEKIVGKTCKKGGGGYSCFDFRGNGNKIVVGLENDIGFNNPTGELTYTHSFIMNPCDESNEFSKTLNLLKICYDLLKIGAPILLVIFGMIDMAKAVTSSDESKMKKAQNAFVKRIIAAVIVFLSFVIVEFTINLVGKTSNSEILDCISKIF